MLATSADVLREELREGAPNRARDLPAEGESMRSGSGRSASIRSLGLARESAV
jgi:hypothetical protein